MSSITCFPCSAFSSPGFCGRDAYTTTRGELFALLLLAVLAEELVVIDFVTDNEGVFNAFNKGPKYCATTNNADLYEQLFIVIYEKALLFTVRWMPSHLLEKLEKGVFTGVSEADLYGNKAADDQAGEAAREAATAIPRDVAKDVVYYIILVRQIQLRLANILLDLPDRPQRIKEPKPHKPSLSSLCDSSSHSIVVG